MPSRVHVHADQTRNPYEGIFFYPLNEKYSATITRGRNVETIGTYDTLRGALDARDLALSTRGPLTK
jgi:hypothetical protein